MTDLTTGSGTLVNSIGFEWMLVGIAVLCFCYAPLLILLRAPPTKEEKKVGVGGGSEMATAASTATVEAGASGVDNRAVVPDADGAVANSITKF